MTVRIGEVETFKSVRPDKAQALKPLEEAAEVFGAWQEWDKARVLTKSEGRIDRCKMALLDECADVVQAVCNLVAALCEPNFDGFMEDCQERNVERGRIKTSGDEPSEFWDSYE